MFSTNFKTTVLLQKCFLKNPRWQPGRQDGGHVLKQLAIATVLNLNWIDVMRSN